MGAFNTLFGLATRLRNYGGDVPFGIAATWVQGRLAQLVDYASDGWSWQLASGNWTTHKSIFGTCNVVQGYNVVSNAVPNNGLATVSVAAGGAGYLVGDVLTVGIGTSYYGTVTVASISAGGKVTGVTVAAPGYNYIGGVYPAVGGTGSGTQINVATTGPGSLPGNRTTVVGRQAVFNSITPFFDIVDNLDGASFMISQPYPGVSATVPFEISDIYFTPPAGFANFESLRVFADNRNGVQLPFGFTIEEINNIDPQRTSGSQPYLLADAGWNSDYIAALPVNVTDQNGYTANSNPLPRKEAYPRQQADYVYSFWCKRRPGQMIGPTDKLPPNIRPDVVFEGCLADLAMWEGTPVMPRRPNPVKANYHQARFDRLVQDMQILDGSVMQRVFTSMIGMTRLPYPSAFWSSSFAMRAPWLSAGDEIGSAMGYEIGF